MAESIVMIALSPTMEDGQIIKWNKRQGDKVEEGDVLCDVETDKASMEYESQNEGTILKIIKNEGENAKIGEAIAIIGEENEDISNLMDSINKESDSSSNQKKANVGEKVVINKNNDFNAKVSLEKSNNDNLESNQNLKNRIYASPLAKKLAENNNLSLNSIKGTGPNNRIVKKDIEKIIENINSNKNLSVKEENIDNKTKESINFSRKRQVIAKRLIESKHSMPHYYLNISIIMDEIINLRKNLNEKSDVKIGLNAFLIKFVSIALKKNPIINARLENDKINFFPSVDIAIAVAQEDGLITPIIRNCEFKGIIEIEKNLKHLIKKAKENTLDISEFQGSSFTISNLGSFGIESFTAIINPPASAILAIGAIKKELLVMKNNETKIKSVMKLTLSCDHRIIDGAVAAKFLNDLRKIIENPISIIY